MDFTSANTSREVLLERHFERNGSGVFVGEGYLTSARSTGSWQFSLLKPLFELHGNFDIEVDFTKLNTDEPERTAGVRLEINDSQTPSVQVMTSRSRNQNRDQNASGSARLTDANGKYTYPGKHFAESTTSGTLRLVRVGDTVTSLYAPENTGLYRTLRQQQVSPGPIAIGETNFQVNASGRGAVHAIFTRLSIRAEKLRYQPNRSGRPPEALIVRNLETGKQQTLATAEGELYHVGSPDISPDQKWVVYNRNDENPSNSRLEIIPIDGSQPALDIGEGAVPTFSPDGQRVGFYSPQSGVGYTNIDGSNRTIVSRTGRPAEFARDNLIGFADRRQLWFADLTSGRIQPLLTGPLENRYLSFYWHINFHPASRKVAVRGYRQEIRGSEFAILDLDNPENITILLDDAGPIRPQASWLDNGTLVFVGYMPGFPSSGLFVVDPKKPGQYKPFKFQPEGIEPLDAMVTPDQKWIVIAGKRRPVPQDWPDQTTASGPSD